MRSLVVLSLVVLTSCGVPITSRRSSSGDSGGAYTARCRGDFGASAAAAEFEAFMMATYELHEAATQTRASLHEACSQMAAELGVTPAASGTSDEATRALCEQVATALRTELAAAGEGSETTVEVRTQPPHCEARFESYAECAASCDVSVTPGELELRCSGGEVRGSCAASCTGSCAVEVHGACTGTCEGFCEGECRQRAEDGSCAGQCDGTCQGECVTEAAAECSGECRGSCSVEWERPYCTGNYDPPQVNADCNAACEAHVDASLECRPGQAELIVSGGPDAEAIERLERVRAAVRVGLGNINTIHERLTRLQHSARDVIARMNGLPATIREVGIGAAACSAGAVADLQRSLSTITVTLEVSVTVSASVR